MRTTKAAATILVLVILLTACGQQGARPTDDQLLLSFSGKQYYISDFLEYVSFFWPQESLPLDRVTIEQHLDDFVEHRILFDYALGSAPKDTETPQTVAQEIVLIQDVLQQLVMQEVDDYEARLRQMFNEFFTEERVEILSVYYSDELTANSEARRLRRNPDQFEDAMEANNPEGMMRDELGQGIYSVSQLPEEWRKVIFELDEPGIAGPIEIPNGYIVVKVIQFLGKPDFNEKRNEIEHVFMTQERNKFRKQLLTSLQSELTIEYYPERVTASPAYVKESIEQR